MAHAIKDSDGKVTISYPVREATLAVSEGEYFAVRKLGAQNRIFAIKFIRMQYGIGLIEGKNVVDTILNCGDALAERQE